MKGSGHPDFTCYSKDNKKCIDYILYSRGHFRTVSVLEMPALASVSTPYLPNEHFPSDHLRIEAVLNFI